jgi:hypothetical protein
MKSPLLAVAAAGHHGVLGAAAGCLYGRHHAKEQERQRQQQSQVNGQGKL